MAYELSKKVVIDTQEFNDYAVGLSIPLKNGNGGFFEQNYTTFDQARSNLKNLLLTKKGERIAQPNFGSGLQDLLFEQIDDEFEGKLVDTVTEAVQTWLPYINIEDIDVNMSNENKDNNRVGVEIKFRVGETLDLNSVTFTVGN
jgi:phage baseplate assembly protein W|tara:strand:- start:1303 stop:1734 length:432 start_codon:yes stop_codon:yes gene_type:complete